MSGKRKIKIKKEVWEIEVSSVKPPLGIPPKSKVLDAINFIFSRLK